MPDIDIDFANRDVILEKIKQLIYLFMQINFLKVNILII